MRKLLLATAVAMGSLGGLGVAQAQVVTVPTLLPGTSPFGGPTVAPGSVVVRLGGRIEFFASDLADSGDKVSIPASSTSGLGGQTYKKQNYSFANYARLYPSVDGVAANGLQYGGFIEIRHENYGGAGNGGGGGGVNDGTGGSSSSAADRFNGLLYVRREYVYLGAPAFGTLRLGSTDGPSSLFETGTFENFNDGAWNGDVPNMFSANAVPATVPFATVGIMYATSKAVYLSPTFAGFNFGLAYEPTSSAVSDYGGGQPANVTAGVYNSATPCNFAEPGCDALSSSSSNANRRRNLVDVAAHYTGTFGPVGIAAQLGYIGSQHIGASGTATAPTGPATRYSGLNIGDAGLVVTVAGLSVGGHITGGKLNGQWALAPVGATPAIWALGGASYALGPLIVGASFFQYDSPGSSGPTGTPGTAGIGQLRERGIAAGGTYSLAPGVAVFASYLNGNRKENGVNLLGDGNPSTSHNQTNANGFALGTFIRW